MLEPPDFFRVDDVVDDAVRLSFLLEFDMERKLEPGSVCEGAENIRDLKPIPSPFRWGVVDVEAFVNNEADDAAYCCCTGEGLEDGPCLEPED